MFEMKRPQEIKRLLVRTGDIKKDMTEKQLAGIGAFALAFNEAEHILDSILALSMSSAPAVSGSAFEFTGRINGLQGKVELAKIAVRGIKGSLEFCKLLSNTLGNDGFLHIKGYRDAIVHTRAFSASTGIGVSPSNRGKFQEILLTEDALELIYERTVALGYEMQLAYYVVQRLVLLRRTDYLYPDPSTSTDRFSDYMRQHSGPARAQLEQEIQVALVQVREHQIRRLSLAPLPEFPSEQELRASDDEWLRDHQPAAFDADWPTWNPPHDI